MPSVVLDASTLVGALLKEGSIPERALLLARSHATICLSDEVENEIREVFARPKFHKYFTPGRVEWLLALLTAASCRAKPLERITGCRDAKDNIYLELALAVRAAAIVSSDSDLLVLYPWRDIPVLTPSEFVTGITAGALPGIA